MLEINFCRNGSFFNDFDVASIISKWYSENQAYIWSKNHLVTIKIASERALLEIERYLCADKTKDISPYIKLYLEGKEWNYEQFLGPEVIDAPFMWVSDVVGEIILNEYEQFKYANELKKGNNENVSK